MGKQNQLRAVLVDDDSQSRKLLNILLKKFPEVKVVGEASSIPKALTLIKEKKPDSIFLDICLGSGSGFDLLNNISSETNVVFVSAFDDYALRAFEVNALDYLQKPIEFDRLALTISRLLGIKEHAAVESAKAGVDNNIITAGEEMDDSEDNYNVDEEGETEELSEDQNGYKKNLEYDDRLFITVDGISRFIKVNSILCITAEKDYTYIYLNDGKKFLVLKPMVEWEERLTPKFFVRIHRSTIVNLEYVEKVEKWFNSSYHVYIQNIEEPFQMSRRYASKLKERFK